jgi:hypothetical protein
MDTAVDIKHRLRRAPYLGTPESTLRRAPINGELLCTEVLQGATEHDKGSVSLESLTEKVSTLGLQTHKRNRCGAAKRWACTARCSDAPTGESACG